MTVYNGTVCVFFYHRVRIWDVMILVPNALFLAYLLLKLRNSVDTLRSNYSPIITTFYILVRIIV